MKRLEIVLSGTVVVTTKSYLGEHQHSFIGWCDNSVSGARRNAENVSLQHKVTLIRL